MTDAKTEIRAKIDLRELIEEAGAVFSTETRATCPIHGGENKAALALYDKGQRWHSYTEGVGGDIFAFYMAWKRVDFKQALQDLARRANVELAPPPPPLYRKASPQVVYQDIMAKFLQWAEEQLWEHQGILAYLSQERGWSQGAILEFWLGYNPQDQFRPKTKWGTLKDVYLSKGLVIPHLGADGKPFWFNIRRPCPGDSLAQHVGAVSKLPEVKYTGAPQGQRRLYGSHTHQGHNTLLLVEGEADCITAWDECRDVADIATFGQANLNKLNRDDALYLTRYERVLACFDPDKAGQRGLRALCAQVGRVEPVSPPSPEGDLNDYAKQGGNLRNWLSVALAQQGEMVLS